METSHKKSSTTLWVLLRVKVCWTADWSEWVLIMFKVWTSNPKISFNYIKKGFRCVCHDLFQIFTWRGRKLTMAAACCFNPSNILRKASLPSNINTARIFSRVATAIATGGGKCQPSELLLYLMKVEAITHSCVSPHPFRFRRTSTISFLSPQHNSTIDFALVLAFVRLRGCLRSKQLWVVCGLAIDSTLWT
jgi:hypothetical protein